MSKYVMALDQGTTSSRAILFDRSGRVAAMAQQTFPQHYPQPGWVEHDPLEIWESQRSVAAQALRKLGPDAHIAGIGITNQRETTILWDKATGEPVYNAIVWQCRRTAGICDKLKETPGMAETIAEKTGLPVKGYCSGPLGGDQQIGSRIVEGGIDFLVFLWDPLEAQPHDPDVRALSRIAVLYDIPTANNLATADFMLKSEFMNSTYERKVENFNKTIQDRVEKMK